MDESDKIRLIGLLNGKHPISGIEKHFLKVMRGDARPATPLEREWVEWAFAYKNRESHQAAKSLPSLSKESSAPVYEDQNSRLKKAIEIADKQLNKKIRSKNPTRTIGWTSLDQGNQKIGDNAVKKLFIDEGIGGSREDNKLMRSNQNKDMLKRNNGIS